MGRIEPRTFLRVGKVAEILGMTIKEVHRRVAKGQLVAEQVSGRWRFPLASVRAYTEQRVGELDAEVFALIRQGKDDADIVIALRVPLERVRLLREAASSNRVARSRAKDDEDYEAFFAQQESELRARIDERLERIRLKRSARLERA